MNPIDQIIDKYYAENSDLRRLLLTHSTLVAHRALRICELHPELGADRDFVREAAMLHDIGICRCYAPTIHCHGTQPYILHGREGAMMLRAEGMERHARVCERHTGAGLSKKDIETQQLPLPHEDFLPETIEEQIICYADKFYSKTNPTHEKTVEEAEHSLLKFGADGPERFRQWMRMFE